MPVSFVQYVTTERSDIAACIFSITESHLLKRVDGQCKFFCQSNVLLLFVKLVKHPEAAGHECGGGLIFHSAIRIPLLKFFKIPFALFVGTSNLHRV